MALLDCQQLLGLVHDDIEMPSLLTFLAIVHNLRLPQPPYDHLVRLRVHLTILKQVVALEVRALDAFIGEVRLAHRW